MTPPAIITPTKTGNDDFASLTGPKAFVPLREAPDAEDPYDPRRALILRTGWSMLDDLYRPQQRQIEENVRMVSGQQHAFFHAPTGRWMDLADWMTPEERSWKPRPIFNMLLPWYIITHARATENTPIVTYVPGPDRADAELAEILDIAEKTVWYEANMEDVHDRTMAWVIIAGRGHQLCRVNPNKGAMRPWVGTDMVPVVDPYDQPVVDPESNEQAHIPQDNVPFGPDGKPRAVFRMSAPGQGELVPTGDPHQTPVGSIEVDVLSPLQCRKSWGPDPWWKARRHFIKTYLTPEEVYDLYNVQVEPDVRGQVGDVGELERILYGSGFFGTATGRFGDQTAQVSTDGYVEVTQMWEAPCSYGGLNRTGDSPGGRWLVGTAKGVILRDGVRPAPFPYTSPLHTFEFIRLPGRPGGMTVQEPLNQIQREINDGIGRIKAHVNLNTNPKAIIDTMSGLKAGSFSNKPGQNHFVNRRPGVPAIEYAKVPDLGSDVYKHIDSMQAFFQDIGFTAGANDPGTPGDSGEKVKEVRFNTDRFLGPTMRRTAGEYGRVIETWQCLFPLIWDMKTTISYAGEDNIARTIVVYPEMFKEGKVNVRPDVESMLPEGRGEKQEKVMQFYLGGFFGLPGTPQALKKFWEMAHMPHLARAAKVGGIDGTTAERENGLLLLGTPAEQIPVYEWYDDDIHLMILENFMKSREFEERVDPAIKQQFVLHRMAHMFNKQKKMVQAAQQMATINGIANPQPPGGPGGPSGPPKPGGPGPTSGNQPGGPVRPTPPSAPRGPVPGGAMPTALPGPAQA